MTIQFQTAENGITVDVSHVGQKLILHIERGIRHPPFAFVVDESQADRMARLALHAAECEARCPHVHDLDGAMDPGSFRRESITVLVGEAGLIGYPPRDGVEIVRVTP